MRLSDFLEGVGRPVAYYPSMARMLGDLKEAIFICQMAYWKGKEQDPDGWIFKSAEEIEAETGLTYREQTGVRSGLKDKGLLEDRYARTEHKLYFRIAWETVNAMWEEHMTKEHMTNCKMPPEHQTKGQMPSDKKEDGISPKRVSLNSNTETTTEITQINKDWEKVLSLLSGDFIRNGSFEKYTAGTRPLRYDGNALVVAAADIESAEWLESRVQRSAERQLVGILGREVAVQFVVLDEVPA